MFGWFEGIWFGWRFDWFEGVQKERGKLCVLIKFQGGEGRVGDDLQSVSMLKRKLKLYFGYQEIIFAATLAQEKF